MMSSAAVAVSALEQWALECPEAATLIVRAKAISLAATMARVKMHAASHGVDATTVVWSDAECPLRKGGAALGNFCMDLRVRCKEPAIYFTPGKHHKTDLMMAASLPLADVQLPSGRSLQDFLVDTLQVRTIPRDVQCRVQALVVYSPKATVMFSTYAYNAIQTETFIFLPDGQMGHRTGDGRVGVAGRAMAFDTAPLEGAGAPAAPEPPTTVMVVTLFHRGVPARATMPGTVMSCHYRGLRTAEVTLSAEEVPDMPYEHMEGKHVVAARVEIIECHLVTNTDATAGEVGEMCRRVLKRQLDLKPADKESVRAAERSLQNLEGLAYCANGHGPYTHGGTCVECGALCMCW